MSYISTNPGQGKPDTYRDVHITAHKNSEFRFPLKWVLGIGIPTAIVLGIVFAISL